MSIEKVLRVLNDNQIRATYGAVGQYLGVPAIGVSRLLGTRRPEASWVVSASGGMPTDYDANECHPNLTLNATILRTAQELRSLVASQSNLDGSTIAANATRRVAGVDLAWQTERNPSGIAIGKISENILTVEELHVGVVGLENVIRLLDSASHLEGVAIDAPLIIDNHFGPRPCEGDLDKVYRSRWAGCYPSNLSLYPDAISVRFSNYLSDSGFAHLGDTSRGKWQVECYPHPALIELFELDKRLAYKKGNVHQKRDGQKCLARLIRQLSDRTSLLLHIPSEHAKFVDELHIDQLKGHALKDNEDGLDAILCLYIAGLYAIDLRFRIFGTIDNGYIVVPIES